MAVGAFDDAEALDMVSEMYMKQAQLRHLRARAPAQGSRLFYGQGDGDDRRRNATLNT